MPCLNYVFVYGIRQVLIRSTGCFYFVGALLCCDNLQTDLGGASNRDITVCYIFCRAFHSHRMETLVILVSTYFATEEFLISFCPILLRIACPSAMFCLESLCTIIRHTFSELVYLMSVLMIKLLGIFKGVYFLFHHLMTYTGK